MNWSQVVLKKVEQNQDSFPKDLIAFSEKVEQEKRPHISSQPENKNRFFGDGFYASPIIALNRRDLQALADFFNREDMSDIDMDLKKLLKLLLPDFYQEDQKVDITFQGDPTLDFLQEFL